MWDEDDDENADDEDEDEVDEEEDDDYEEAEEVDEEENMKEGGCRKGTDDGEMQDGGEWETIVLTQHLVGQKVRRFFKGFGWYDADIASQCRNTKTCEIVTSVTYADGDSEDMSEVELAEYRSYFDMDPQPIGPPLPNRAIKSVVPVVNVAAQAVEVFSPAKDNDDTKLPVEKAFKPIEDEEINFSSMSVGDSMTLLLLVSGGGQNEVICTRSLIGGRLGFHVSNQFGPGRVYFDDIGGDSLLIPRNASIFRSVSHSTTTPCCRLQVQLMHPYLQLKRMLHQIKGVLLMISLTSGVLVAVQKVRQ